MPNTSLRRPQKGYARRGGKQAYHGAGGSRTRTFAATTRAEATSADERAERTLLAHQIDEAMGFARFESGRRKEGWLVSVQPTTVGLGPSDSSGGGDGGVAETRKIWRDDPILGCEERNDVAILE